MGSFSDLVLVPVPLAQSISGLGASTQTSSTSISNPLLDAT